MADPDPGDLVLVLHDELAPRLLAWWDKVQPGPGEIDLATLERVLMASREEIEATIERCQIARLVGPSGISLAARKWLTTIASAKLTQ